MRSRKAEKAAADRPARGCVVTELTAAELERFRAAVQPLYDHYAADREDLLSAIAAMADP